MTPETLAVKDGTIGRGKAGKFGLKLASQRYFYDSLNVANLRHWDRTAFTSTPKEDVLSIFLP
jgi:hypothetical protein